MQHRTDENVYLLAKCYHHSGRVNQAIAVLEGSKRAQNRYLLAVCCFQQGKLIEAENALRGDGDHHFVDVQASEQIPNGAAGLYLMGRICRRANRREQAIMFFTKRYANDYVCIPIELMLEDALVGFVTQRVLLVWTVWRSTRRSGQRTKSSASSARTSMPHSSLARQRT